MRGIILLAICLILQGCGASSQPESIKIVAAFEIHLPTETQRNEFLAIMSQVAEAEGHHLDFASQQELKRTAKSIPRAKMTIHAAVWRGANDDECLATIMDQHDHLGQVWIAFTKGKDPVVASSFRKAAMDKIKHRWPDILSLPIMPNGAIPLHRDLIRTPSGYVVSPDAASKYAATRES